MSFVKTPCGVILHADAHREAVAKARRHDLQGMLLMLEPAEAIDASELYRGIDLQAGTPVNYVTTPLTEETIREGIDALLAERPDEVDPAG